MSVPAMPTFLPLDGIYEPSAVQQLPDGRFLVVEDERRHPFSVFTIAADGTVRSSALKRSLLQIFSSFWELEDLEGLACDKRGYLYAITSHSRDDEGREKKSREKLVRFRVKGTGVFDTAVFDGLKSALTSTYAVLATAAKVGDVKGGNGLNIEALAISEDQGRMMIGFRSPLIEGRAIVCTVENFGDVFDDGATPVFGSGLEELDLDGFGIRGLSFVPALGEYLVIGGPASKVDLACGLWRWKGPGAKPRRVAVDGLQDFAHAEGVCSAQATHADGVLVVSDDGDRKLRRYATYLLFDSAKLT